MKHCDLDVITETPIEVGIKHIAINGKRYFFNSMCVLVCEYGETFLINGVHWHGGTWKFSDGKNIINIKGVRKNIANMHRAGEKETFLDYILFPLHQYETKVEQVVLCENNEKVMIVNFDNAYQDNGYLIFTTYDDTVKLYKYSYSPTRKNNYA